MKPWVLAGSLLCPVVAFSSATGPTALTISPSNPLPGSTITVVATGRADGCPPRGGTATIEGNLIRIVANADADPCGSPCAQIDQPYTLQVRLTLPNAPANYTVEYDTKDCSGGLTVMAAQQLSVSFFCDFARTLTIDRSASRVGDAVTLSWCDPSFRGVDLQYVVSGYSIYSSKSAAGPFTKLIEIPAASSTSATIHLLDPGATYFFVASHGCEGPVGACPNASAPDRSLNSNIVSAVAAAPSACLPAPATLCLNSGRFEVTTQFRTTANTPFAGHAVPLTDQSGYFWFFNADNVEVTVKVLKACPAYWVFASGMTNVYVDLNVRDTLTGRTKKYNNPLGTPFAPILDTSAFSCP